MEKKMSAAVATVIVLGFFCGTTVPGLFHMNQGSYAGLLSRYALQNLACEKLEPAALFYYVFRNRTIGLTLLWMSCYTPVGLALHLMILFWLLHSLGLLISIFLLRYGLRGILLLLCCTLPQWVIYISILRQELSFLAEKSKKQTGFYRYDIQIYGKMFLACLGGCLLETWFGLYVFQIAVQTCR